MQLALGCDRAIVATTDSTRKVVRFAQQQKVGLLSKQFLDRLQNKLDLSDRLTLEQFHDNVRKYPDHKQDGDWIRQIADAKSAVISLQGYPAFNKSIAAFRFFADRAQTRPKHKEQALRCAYFAAALACIALDAALGQVLYEESSSRYRAIAAGVTYGDAGDARVQKSIETALSIIAEGMENGRVVARQAKDALDKLFENVRADIVAEHFTKEHNASTLFAVARDLEDRAHRANPEQIQTLSTEAKSVLGVFADFVQVKRALSRCRLDGSDSLSVQILFVEWQHSSAEQVNAGTAIHGTFEGLELVNLSFRLSVAPRFKHGIANGLDILPYCPSKTANTIDARLACVM